MGSDTLQLIIVWAIAVVAFFALWAVLLKVIRRIGERKSQTEDNAQDETAERPSRQSIEGNEKAS